MVKWTVYGGHIRILIVILSLIVLAVSGYIWLPERYNPFAPLDPADPATYVTAYKLDTLERHPESCLALLADLRRRGEIQYQTEADRAGSCPLHNVVRVMGFGSVRLSSSFVASCGLALRSALFVNQQAVPLTLTITGQRLAQIDHLGSFDCRNIYHLAHARRSEHATADALDVSGFRLADGAKIRVDKAWGDSGPEGALLSALVKQGCHYYGNILGPDYNAAHANHFHFGVRGFSWCL